MRNQLIALFVCVLSLSVGNAQTVEGDSLKGFSAKYNLVHGTWTNIDGHGSVIHYLIPDNVETFLVLKGLDPRVSHECTLLKSQRTSEGNPYWNTAHVTFYVDALKCD